MIWIFSKHNDVLIIEDGKLISYGNVMFSVDKNKWLEAINSKIESMSENKV